MLIVAGLFALTAGPAAAVYPNCWSRNYCGVPGSGSYKCTCNATLRWFSTCAVGCELSPAALTALPSDAGLPNTVLTDLGIFAY